MPMVGETLAGRYRIDAALGAGATAVVYRAHDLRLERDVAIKVLLPNLARDPLVAGRFDREARALAASAHPGVVAVYDVDRGDPLAGREPFFVMELCEGGSLADVLDAAGGRLSPEQIAPILATIAGGVASLHARGFIHRDVKPHNILICGGTAKLADFGLARAQDTTRLTAAGTGAGTLAYLAPELLGGEDPGPPADIYGLGVVAFQALTGRLPRPSTSMVDLVDSRLAPVAPVSVVAPDLGRAFDEVVGAALSPDPDRRPPPMAFAAGIGRALQQWRTERHAGVRPAPIARPDRSTQAIRVPRSGTRGVGDALDRGRRPRRSLLGPVIAAIALGVLAAIVIIVLLLAAGGGPGPTPSPTRGATTRPTATATASPTASASASPSPSPSPSPTPTPTPTSSPSPMPTLPPVTAPATSAPTGGGFFSPTQARNSLSNIYSAIESAETTGRIAKKDATDLRHAADEVDKALNKNDDGQMAAKAAEALDLLFQKKVDEGALQDTGELRQEVAKLRSFLPAVA